MSLIPFFNFTWGQPFAEEHLFDNACHSTRFRQLLKINLRGAVAIAAYYSQREATYSPTWWLNSLALHYLVGER